MTHDIPASPGPAPRAPHGAARGSAWRWLAGPLLWASAFVSLYAAAALGCEAAWRPHLTAVLLGLWGVHLLALAALTVALCARDDAAAGAFGRRVPALVSGAALAGTLWIGWPMLAVPACVQPAASAALATGATHG